MAHTGIGAVVRSTTKFTSHESGEELLFEKLDPGEKSLKPQDMRHESNK